MNKSKKQKKKQNRQSTNIYDLYNKRIETEKYNEKQRLTKIEENQKLIDESLESIEEFQYTKNNTKLDDLVFAADQYLMGLPVNTGDKDVDGIFINL